MCNSPSFLIWPWSGTTPPSPECSRRPRTHTGLGCPSEQRSGLAWTRPHPHGPAGPSAAPAAHAAPIENQPQAYRLKVTSFTLWIFTIYFRDGNRGWSVRTIETRGSWSSPPHGSSWGRQSHPAARLSSSPTGHGSETPRPRPTHRSMSHSSYKNTGCEDHMQRGTWSIIVKFIQIMREMTSPV